MHSLLIPGSTPDNLARQASRSHAAMPGQRRQMVLIICLLFSILAPAIALGKTKIIVQNNTPFEFLSTPSALDPVRGSAWEIGATRILPGRREVVLTLNRDEGITAGKEFKFITRLSKDKSLLGLQQKLRGSTVSSHMWQSLSGPGFQDPWFDDRKTHTAQWNLNGMPIKVLYRAFFTGTDDNIEYILQYSYPVEASKDNEFNVLAYNIYMRPKFQNGQAIRARLLPEHLKGYDAIVFSEAFDDDVRAVLLDGLRSEYPYATKILGSDRGIEQDGGVIIVSRWPIATEDQELFGDICDLDDCLSDKGVLYARIQRNARTFHIFGSHTQAWPKGRNTREKQFAIIKKFIDSKAIPADQPVLIAGDLNADRLGNPDEYQSMLRILNAEEPTYTGLAATYDPKANRLADQNGKTEYLDYVLLRKMNGLPNEYVNEARLMRSSEEWKEYGFEYALWDLSDHFPVRGYFRWDFQGRFDMRFHMRGLMYVVRPNGDVVELIHNMLDDRRTAEDKAQQKANNPAPSLGQRIRDTAVSSPTARIGSTVSSRVEQAQVPQSPGNRSPGVAGSKAIGDRLDTVRTQIQRPIPLPPGQDPPATLSHKLVQGTVARGWQNYTSVLPGERNSYYTITADNRLELRRHPGYEKAAADWENPVALQTTLPPYRQLISGGAGILYRITDDGTLHWTHQTGGTGPGQTPTLAPWKPVQSNWGQFVHVFSSGEGVLYGIRPDGTLVWHKHAGYFDGSPQWSVPAQISNGWNICKQAFSTGDGDLYCITEPGELVWYKHRSWQSGKPDLVGPVIIGNAGSVARAFPMLSIPDRPR